MCEACEVENELGSLGIDIMKHDYDSVVNHLKEINRLDLLERYELMLGEDE